MIILLYLTVSMCSMIGQFGKPCFTVEPAKFNKYVTNFVLSALIYGLCTSCMRHTCLSVQKKLSLWPTIWTLNSVSIRYLPVYFLLTHCSCKPGVQGEKCTECMDGYKNFSTSGCSPCNCDGNGSLSEVCNEVSQQCPCKVSTVLIQI